MPRHSRESWLGKKPFHADGCRGPVSGGSDYLPDRGWANVAGGENAGHSRLHFLVGGDIASLIKGLKESEYFSQIEVKDISRGRGENLNFSLAASLDF